MQDGQSSEFGHGEAEELSSTGVSFEIAEDGEMVESGSDGEGKSLQVHHRTMNEEEGRFVGRSNRSPIQADFGLGPEALTSIKKVHRPVSVEEVSVSSRQKTSSKHTSIDSITTSTSNFSNQPSTPPSTPPQPSPLSTFLKVFPTPPNDADDENLKRVVETDSESLPALLPPSVVLRQKAMSYCSPELVTADQAMHGSSSFLPSGASLNKRQHQQLSPRKAPSVLSHSRSLPSVAWSTQGSIHSSWSGPSGYPSSCSPPPPPDRPPPQHGINTVYEDDWQSNISDQRPSRQKDATILSFHPVNPRARSGTLSSTSSTIATCKSSLHQHPFATTPTSTPSLLPPTTIFLNHHYSPSNPHPQLRTMAPAQTFAQSLPPAHQVNLVSQEDMQEDDETCPICVESLGFSYRLPGEKPHVIPECGHSLHEACFVAVYGPVPRSDGPRKLNLGVCGVCRKPMRIGDGDAGGGSNKLAMLMGTGNGNSSSSRSRGAPPPLTSPSRNGHRSDSHLDLQPSSPDLTADDPLEPSSAASRMTIDSQSAPPRVVIPSISIKSEHPSISRIKDGVKGKQLVTAVLSIDVPPAGDRGRYPAHLTHASSPVMRGASSSGSDGLQDQLSPQLPPSPRSASSLANHPTSSSAALVPPPTTGGYDAFANLSADLKHRVQDYKAHGLDSLGPIKLFDLLKVRKGSQIREFHVYLFQDALICISEEKKKGLRNFLSSSSSHSNPDGSSSNKGVLKLKGRIFLRHVRRVFDSTIQKELSLTIVMEDETLDSFILTFKDQASHETWKSNITRLMEQAKGLTPASAGAQVVPGGGGSKASRMMGDGAPHPATTPFSPASTLSSSRSEDHLRGHASSSIRSASTFTNFTSSSPIAATHSFQQSLAPVHTPIDLTIVLSIPSPSTAAASSAATLKTRLVRGSLSFALSLMGPRDRISIVTCELGPGGKVRKTPLLAPTRKKSRRRLESFVELIGVQRGDDEKDEFDVPMNEERQDVVAAVNVGLDVVLQRRTKNTLAGMILICDTAESIKRAQMDLVLARLEAANVPIHAMGYGKAHDPSPLWMLSNNTHGSYTFVKEWYRLRDSLAGVIGGLMSIALTNMKVHLSCQDNEFRVHKISGTTQAVVSTNGKDVDIELRELRHGERKEILIELEIDFSPDRSSASLSQRGSSDDLQHGLGINGLSLEDSNKIYEEQLIDEVPVVEVDCSFHDPAVGRSVARLAHPVLLTVAILPKATAPPVADPTVQRRKMELFASDMITRALLLASRRNWNQASRILVESKRMIHTVIQQLHSNAGASRSKREMQVHAAIEALGAVVQDLDTLQEGIDEQRDLFDRDHRNYAAQQAMILRGQKSWTTRTNTERLYCTEDTQQIIQLSGEWTSRT